MSAPHLRAYLRKLPDFDDIEAEENALDHVQQSRSPIGALSFLIDWPALDRAAALVIEQASNLEGIFDHILIPAADALAARHPLAATLALRAMIDFAIGQRQTIHDEQVARHLQECASLSSAIEDFGRFETHEAYEARLTRQHDRKPYQANRTLGVLSKMFSLAEVWGLRPDGSNPCRHVKRYKERNRERFLSPEETERLGDVLRQAEDEMPSAVAAFRLLLLTGCRLSEIQFLRWEYVKDDYIELPDAKTGGRVVPLGPEARAVLAGLSRENDNPWVISGKLPGSHITDLQKPWRRIRARAGLEDVRIHDLRHSYASRALALGESLTMIGKLLGHTQVQTTARYAQLARDSIQNAAARITGSIGGNLAPSDQRAAHDVSE